MRFSKKSEYGLRALIELTKHYGHPITRQQIAEAERRAKELISGNPVAPAK